MALQWPPKDPDDMLDYTLDFSLWLNGDVISNASSTVDFATSASLSVYKVDFSSGVKVISWLQGGTSGDIASVNVIASTSLGRTKEVTVVLPIMDN
jgi:hypothetical protein